MPGCNRQFFVITGGPGAGKTTLIDALKAAGFGACEEAGRQIIKDQRAISGKALPSVDPALFAEMMLALDMRSYAAWAARPGTVFFDRGVPDVIGYLRLFLGPVPPHITDAARRFGPAAYDERCRSLPLQPPGLRVPALAGDFQAG